MEKDSIPDENAGDLEDHSQQTESADTVDESQPSNEEDNKFFGNEEQEETSDDASSTQTTDTDDDTDDSNDSTVDPELAKWAESQNISLETPTEIKLAQRLRDTQKGFHEAKAESKQKFDDATSDSTDGDKLGRIEARLARQDFFEANPDARTLEGEMFDIAVAAKESGDTEGFKYYQTPQGWKTLFEKAQLKKLQADKDGSFDAGRETERKNLAKKQQATKTKANAQSSSPSSNKVTDEQIAKMSLAEYKKYKAENPVTFF